MPDGWWPTRYLSWEKCRLNKVKYKFSYNCDIVAAELHCHVFSATCWLKWRWISAEFSKGGPAENAVWLLPTGQAVHRQTPNGAQAPAPLPWTGKPSTRSGASKPRPAVIWHDVKWRERAMQTGRSFNGSFTVLQITRGPYYCLIIEMKGSS